MKTNLKLFLALITIFTIGHLRAQQTDPDIQHAKSEILGEWVNKNDSSSRMIFYSDGTYKGYYNQELIYTYQYDIRRTCDPNQVTMADNLLLITYDEDGNKLGCDIIQALNNNNSHILSITTGNQGKHIVYKRP